MLCVLAPMIAVVNVCTKTFLIIFVGDNLQAVEVWYQYDYVEKKKHNENA